MCPATTSSISRRVSASLREIVVPARGRACCVRRRAWRHGRRRPRRSTTRLSASSEVGLERAGRGFAALRRASRPGRRPSVDAGAAFGELLQVGFQRARQDIAALASFSTWPATSPSMLARFRPASRGRPPARGKDVAAFGELLDLAGDQPVDAGAALGELAEIGLQRPGQDVAAFGQLADMAGDHLVNVRCGFGRASAGLRSARGRGCRGRRAAVPAGFRATASMLARASLTLRRSSSSARDDHVAAFGELLDLAGRRRHRSRRGLRRISAGRPAAPRPCGRGLRRACGLWFSTASSMPARASASRWMSASKARDTTWRAASRRPAKSPARASSMDEVDLTMSAISAPILRLALVDHADKVSACPR